MGELDEYVSKLIAEIDGVAPENVTSEYIRQQNEKQWKSLEEKVDKRMQDELRD